ncbi:MAG: translation elongation factor 4 [Clostridia bacterium]|nr:translation elongation factor 4 [Clostridia bacterium]MDD4376487.1 translation elongation factor 4 [Clostridia bacterium]
MVNKENIRNFSIIAHIDHGKSTLADRLIQITGAIETRDLKAQMLDNMDIERERGITIKSQAVRMKYIAKDNKEYILNLIDTPGHVDFNYEVSRSLAACEGAILVVDSAQGVEAQTLANVYLALENNLEIIPVLNKIDLPSARPDEIKEEIENIIGIEAMDAPCVSAKSGINMEAVLEEIVNKVPAPKGDVNAPTKALIFDSVYDNYKGAVAHVRIMDGKISKGDEILTMSNGVVYEVVEIGYFKVGGYVEAKALEAGEVGYIAASIKNVSDIRVGDTITQKSKPATEPLEGYKEVKSMVYAGVFPADGSDYEELKEALMKLKLNDASLNYELESSAALGHGFRCGFLGLLHMEIIQERIEREHDISIITTAPSVIYKMYKTDGEVLELYNPADMPSSQEIDYMEEPIAKADIIVPKEYVGNVMELSQERRGKFINMKYIDDNRVTLEYEIPLNEIIYDFFNSLKSRSKGYASFDYEISHYEKSNLVKLDILLNGDIVDALSFIVHRTNAETRGRKIAGKLKDIIPRHLFEIPIQAAIGGKVVARETVRALRKDVLAKCYGGDISRKKKLLEKQKEGKKKMRQVGNVELPQDAFMTALKVDE